MRSIPRPFSHPNSFGRSTLAICSKSRSAVQPVVARLARPAEPGDPARLLAVERRRAAAKLEALGAAFGELAEGYLKPVTLPDEQALTRRLRGRLRRRALRRRR